MPVKKKNARAGGRFLSLFFVIIRTFLSPILNFSAGPHKKFPDVSRHSGRCYVNAEVMYAGVSSSVDYITMNLSPCWNADDIDLIVCFTTILRCFTLTYAPPLCQY